MAGWTVEWKHTLLKQAESYCEQLGVLPDAITTTCTSQPARTAVISKHIYSKHANVQQPMAGPTSNQRQAVG